MSVGGNKQTISYFGHIYCGKTKDGYAVCDKCGAIENSDEAAKLCPRFLKNCTLVDDKLLAGYLCLEKKVQQLQAENKKLRSALLNISAGSIASDTLESMKATATVALKGF